VEGEREGAVAVAAMSGAVAAVHKETISLT
jgi:hypothetical protein